MEQTNHPANNPILRGQSAAAKSLRQVAQETAKLWCKHHLTYDQTKQLAAPDARRRMVGRLGRTEVAQLIKPARAHGQDPVLQMLLANLGGASPAGQWHA